MWDQFKITSDSDKTFFFGNDSNRLSIFDDEPVGNARAVFERFRKGNNVPFSNKEPAGQAYL
jgi:hypothetical protein